jgi:hypothetical protein
MGMVLLHSTPAVAALRPSIAFIGQDPATGLNQVFWSPSPGSAVEQLTDDPAISPLKASTYRPTFAYRSGIRAGCAHDAISPSTKGAFHDTDTYG